MNNQGCTIWFTGLSGAGKTTIAKGVEAQLRIRNFSVEILDGDAVRNYLSKDLGYSKIDRDINIRRIGYVASLLTRNKVITIVSAISPYRETRQEVRDLIERFVEVYIKASLSVCEQRDVKGLYLKARRGEIKGFTGVDDPYEEPTNPEIICNTEEESIAQSIDKVIRGLEKMDYI